MSSHALSTRAAPAPSSTAMGYLRAALVLLVIAHHVATAYAPLLPGPLHQFDGAHMVWGAFPIVSHERWLGFLVMLGVNDTFFMSLLFLLSGLFVTSSLERRGTAGFLGNRLVRLGAPFLLAVAFLAPLAYFPAYMQITGSADVGDFVSRWLRLGSLPAGPAWFIWVLLAFDGAAVLLSTVWRGWAQALGRLLPDGKRRPALFFLTLILLSAAAYIPMAMAFGSSRWTVWGVLNFQTSRIFLYALYFMIGVAVGARGLDAGLLSQEGGLRKGWWVWVLSAVPATVLGLGLIIAVSMAKGAPGPVREAVTGVSMVVCCATFSFAWMAVFLRFFRRPNPVMNSLTANSYGIYLVHYVFVNWLDYALLGPSLPAGAKFAIAFVGAALLSWITAALFNRLGRGRRAVPSLPSATQQVIGAAS